MHFDYLETSPDAAWEALAECHKVPLSNLIEILKDIPEVDSDDFDRSNTIRKALTTHLLHSEGWQQNFLGLEAIPRSRPNKNYVIDFIFDGACRDCQNRHRLLVEICFDNRQAIGTNILKLDASAHYFESKTLGVPLSIIVCAERAALDDGGWDSGVGDEEEYLIAIDTAYKHHLKSEISLVIMRKARRVD